MMMRQVSVHVLNLEWTKSLRSATLDMADGNFSSSSSPRSPAPSLCYVVTFLPYFSRTPPDELQTIVVIMG